MIDFIEGDVRYIDPDCIIVNVNGVGYRIFCGNPFAYQGDVGETVCIHTHYHVKEDAVHLYGFSTRDQRSLFRQLIEVSGVGPKAALSILASSSPQQIVWAVQEENIKVLTSFPGIGKKTAQRIILDLKDKIKGVEPEDGLAITQEASAAATSEGPSPSSFQEAMEALESLGYRRDEINKIMGPVREKTDEHTPVDEIVKKALRLLVQT